MKRTIKNISDTQIEINVTLEATELAAAEKTAVETLSEKVEVKGFRKGKAPADVVKNKIDPMELANHTAEIAINNALITIINEEKIRPLDQPQVELGNYKPGQELKFVVKITTVPKIKLANYKKLAAKRMPFKINEEDIEQVLDNLLNGQAKKHAVKRAAQAGDEAVLDFVGQFAKDGQEFSGGSGKDFPLKLGSEQFIPGFEEAIIGHKAGEQLDIPLTFPDDYHAANLAGQKVVFKTTIKAVNELKQPKLDDKFAAGLGAEHVKTVADLRADIERELNSRAQYDQEQRFRDALIEELVQKTDISVPEILLNDQITAMERDFTQNLTHQQRTLENYLEEKGYKDKDEWIKKELQEIAEKRAKAGLILAELATQEKITVSEEEVQARIQAMQMQYNDPNLKQMYENPVARRNVANQIATEKTLVRLTELNS
jgi:trigger factor